MDNVQNIISKDEMLLAKFEDTVHVGGAIEPRD